MKKNKNKLIFIVLCFIIFCIGFNINDVEAADANGNFVIVLDPGHGGSDPGASGGGLIEAVINYKIACFAKMELEQYEGVKVHLTRTNNLPTIAQRVDIAQNYNADLLISMHIDSGSKNSRGATSWVTSDKTQVEYYQKSSEVANRMLSKIGSLGIKNNGVQTRLSNDARWYDSGVKQDYYGIIRYAQLTKLRSILIEHCFISNGSDRTYINSDNKIKALAHADVMGIVESYDLHKKGQSYSPVKSLSLNMTELVLESTSSNKQPVYFFEPKFNPTNSTNKEIEWYSSDPKTVRVWQGKIRGLKEGTATITAISKSNQRIAKCKVTVTKPKIELKSISVDKTEREVGIDETGDIIVKFNPSNCDNKELEWTSSNPDVVRIWYGHFRGLKEGTSTITATSKVNGQSVQCVVKVSDKNKIYVKDIECKQDEYTIDVNEAVDLPYTYSPSNATNAKFVWSSSNPEILRVWNNRFRGLKPGTAYVIVKTEDGKFEKKIKVTIKAVYVKDISLKQNEYSINVNEAIDLPYTYYPSNATNAKFVWSSSNPEILRVWNNRFRGLKSGTAYVIVRTEDGKFEKKIKVTIKDKAKDIYVTDISLKQNEYTINVNEAVDLPYTYSPANSTNAEFIWSSSNPEILRVWNNRFRGLKHGTAYVIVKTEDGKFEKRIKVTIKNNEVNK